MALPRQLNTEVARGGVLGTLPNHLSQGQHLLLESFNKTYCYWEHGSMEHESMGVGAWEHESMGEKLRRVTSSTPTTSWATPWRQNSKSKHHGQAGKGFACKKGI